MRGVPAILGPVHRCNRCLEWWPESPEFFAYLHGRRRYSFCRACGAEGHEPWTWRRARDSDRERDEAYRTRDNARHAEARRDPVKGPAMRAREREAQARYYARNAATVRERMRVYYAERKGAPVRVGFGRPRVVE